MAKAASHHLFFLTVDSIGPFCSANHGSGSSALGHGLTVTEDRAENATDDRTPGSTASNLALHLHLIGVLTAFLQIDLILGWINAFSIDNGWLLDATGNHRESEQKQTGAATHGGTSKTEASIEAAEPERALNENMGERWRRPRRKMIEVVCALIERDRKLLVAKRAAGTSMAGKWEFPGGKLLADEMPEEAIVREIQEELGCRIEVRSALPVNEHHYADISIRLIPFLCAVSDGEPEALEHEMIAWVATEELGSYDWAEADIPVLEAYVRYASGLRSR